MAFQASRPDTMAADRPTNLQGEGARGSGAKTTGLGSGALLILPQHSLVSQVRHPAYLAPHLLRDPRGIRVGQWQLPHGNAPGEEEAQLGWLHALAVDEQLGGEQEGEEELVLLKQGPGRRGRGRGGAMSSLEASRKAKRSLSFSNRDLGGEGGGKTIRGGGYNLRMEAIAFASVFTHPPATPHSPLLLPSPTHLHTFW